MGLLLLNSSVGFVTHSVLFIKKALQVILVNRHGLSPFPVFILSRLQIHVSKPGAVNKFNLLYYITSVKRL